ncbi:hypothetical protein [Xanthomonas citri]|uniref:hypothetical protein n=1 Tax=Xanthomonas citri TaxID=346 RepID=UPI0002EB34D7|nr:hypothetical protein [Xanthomonas citri]
MAKDVAEWIAWWAPSALAAEAMTEADRQRLMTGGWWPPATAEHVTKMPPPSVRLALRFDDQHCREAIAAYAELKKKVQS